MGWKLHNKAFEHAKKLIKEGKISDDKWEKPNLSDFKDIEEYALFHLAKDPDKDPKTASAYAYPYGKEGKVYINALKAIRSAAAGGRGAEENKELFDAAGKLLDQIVTLTGKVDKKEVEKEVKGSIKTEFCDYATINSKEEQIVTGPVLIPNYKDCDYKAGEKLFSAKEIKDLMNTFYPYQYFDVKHSIVLDPDWKNVGELVESWQLKEDWNGYPAGTWMISAKITDDETWNRIKAGELIGFSATTVPKKAVDKLSLKSIVNPFKVRRKPISELEDPVVISISLTDRPCVYDAKILSMKEDSMKEEENVLKKMYELLKGYFSTKEEAEKDEGEKADENVDARMDKDNAKDDVLDIKPALDKVTEKLEETLKKVNALEENIKELKTEPTKETEETKEDKVTKTETKTKETEKPKETKTTKPTKPPERKALPPDAATNTTKNTIYEILGRDAFGRKIT